MPQSAENISIQSRLLKQPHPLTQTDICSTMYQAMLPWLLLAELPGSLYFQFKKRSEEEVGKTTGLT